MVLPTELLNAVLVVLKVCELRSLRKSELKIAGVCKLDTLDSDVGVVLRITAVGYKL